MNNPPNSYRGRTKYNEAKARRYQDRKPGKHLAEMKLIDRAFTLIPKTHRILDIPCGGGRVTLHLSQSGYEVSGVDLSDSMLAIARKNIANHGLKCSIEKQDLEQLSYADRSFDTIISFRLFHHFPTREIRARAVAELCRVARDSVVLSYFTPWSATSLKRWLRRTIGLTPSDKHATSLREIQRYFQVAGFFLVRDFAQSPMIHTLHLAVFRRTNEGKP
ncbi:MAG TPA: class I SAM-dependent methyltransferase [Candidatus Paceibacterota bacterium]|nr:class I SAM-dependent methyltransferase [Verrucomicrobiota bacterium]HRY50831.1 class I SAM-dependent methyltransferase [Candidatus Paceibacterota bacterium]HSA01375.1 class I SAM-dependent methyltransferase [Candidatus Paceibacterota bacterium]